MTAESRGFPSVRVPVLSAIQRVHLFESLKRFDITNQDTFARSAFRTNHNRHRRSQTQRAGASNNENGDCIHQSVRIARLGAKDCPCKKCNRRDREDSRNKPGCNGIGQPLNGRPRSLSFADHFYDRRQQRVPSHSLRLHDEAARTVNRASDQLFPPVFLMGIASPSASTHSLHCGLQ
jgi:hypothetical protein